MSQPFVGEIRCFGFNFAPIDWAFCNGQPVPISNFEALFAIIGTIYGGDGTTTFNLPNLQGQVPMHWGSPTSGPATGFNTTIGQVQGTAMVTLTQAQEPSHTHTITVQEEASGGVVEKTPNPGPNTWLSDSSPDFLWANQNLTPVVQFSPRVISSVGGSLPHDNMQPYLALNFCISLNGIFPSRN
jgi:microcystin-dependent protein